MTEKLTEGLMWQPAQWPRDAGELAEEVAKANRRYLEKYGQPVNLVLLNTKYEAGFEALAKVDGARVAFQSNITPGHLFVAHYTGS